MGKRVHQNVDDHRTILEFCSSKRLERNSSSMACLPLGIRKYLKISNSSYKNIKKKLVISINDLI